MTASSDIAALADAASESFAIAIADFHREAARERELQKAQFAATMAELNAEISAVRITNERLIERLASLKDGKDGEPGPQGERGPQGETGPTGDTGPQGERGEPGADGRDGLNGAEGPEGPQGLIGPQGEQGERGETGERGERGEAGPEGERGPEGAPGKLPSVREWAEGVHYEGMVVTRDGSTYQALRDTAKEPPHEDWLLIAARGSDGKTFVIRGTWSAEEVYQKLHVVALNGGSFIALRDNPGECPGSGWQMISAPGRRGEKGLPGERGEKGQKGEKGDKGESIIEGRFDARNMRLVLVRDDGETIEVDAWAFAESIRKASE